MNARQTIKLPAALIDKSMLYILACSGGMDSMVLAHLLKRYRIKFHIAHVNYRLRGAESDGDELLVKTFAEKNNIPFHLLRVNSKAAAKKNKEGIQEYARKVRYQWMHNLLKETGADYILTAHHKDDQAETIVHQLIRGGGIAALRGMKTVHEKIMRPLLHFAQSDIMHYAKTHKVKWRDDSSNSSTDYTRNFIRHELMPLMKKINSDVTHALTERATWFAEIEDWLKIVADSEIAQFEKPRLKTIEIPTAYLKSHPAARTLLWHVLKPVGFKASQVEGALKLCNAASGKSVSSPTHMLLKDRNHLVLAARNPVRENELSICEAPFSLNQPVRLSGAYCEKPNQFEHDDNIAWIDADLLQWPLKFRLWQPGDSYAPIGMGGKQKVSDILINKKTPLFEKQKTYVLLSGDEIVWMTKHRINGKFRITPKTQKVLRIEIVE